MAQLAKPLSTPALERAREEVLAGKLEGKDPIALIEWGFERFAPRISLSASFGSPEGMVILDLMHGVDPKKTRIFTIDTGRLPQQTYDLIDRVRDRYDIEVEVFFPDAKRVEEMVRGHGLNLFYESVEKRQLCCGIRKVEPLERAMLELDAWVSGLRSDQSTTRQSTRAVEIDAVHGDRIKINPLCTWKRAQVLEYAERRRIPIHALHAEGYPSVGCAPCSRAIAPGEDERAGRWWWELPENRECGIHTGYEEKGSGI